MVIAQSEPSKVVEGDDDTPEVFVNLGLPELREELARETKGTNVAEP